MANHTTAGIVLIDGPSGSGKTTLADRIVAGWPGGCQLVRLEDIYPGWSGLRAASEHVLTEILIPLSEGRPGRWQRWDWVTGSPAEWNPVDPELPVVIEGCGALSHRNAELASVRLWIETDFDTRKSRALARDGETYAPFWDTWQRQWEAFVAAENPAELADLRFDGA